MILLVHMLFGATVGCIVKNSFLAIFLAFLSHYLLDTIPHAEYPVGYRIGEMKNRKWKRKRLDILSFILDFFIGITLVSLFFSKFTLHQQLIIYVCAMIALLPDILAVLEIIIKNSILERHKYLHNKTHFWQKKKIPIFWRIISQILAVIICVSVLV